MVTSETDLHQIRYQEFVVCARELAFLANPTRNQFHSFAQHMSILGELYRTTTIPIFDNKYNQRERLHKIQVWYQRFAGLDTPHASVEDMDKHNFRGCVVDYDVVAAYLVGNEIGDLQSIQRHVVPDCFRDNKQGWHRFVLLSAAMLDIPKPSISLLPQTFDAEGVLGNKEKLESLAEELMERMSAKSFKHIKSTSGFCDPSPQQLERILDETGLKYAYQLPRDGTIKQIE